MSPIRGIWAPAVMRALRMHLVNNARVATKMLRSKLAAATRPLGSELQPIAVRTGSARQPVHPAAWLRQQKRSGSKKWFSSASLNNTVRRFISTSGHAGPQPGCRFDRSKLPTSTISRAVGQLTGRAPFASTLRPNLTGGTLGRTAGGYAVPGAGRIGGVRHFSHTPAAPAQVVQNVSQAMRAFWLSGKRARFDGVGPGGAKRYRAVSAEQEKARLTMEEAMTARRSAAGAFVDFKISPTVTALSPLGVAMPFASAEQQIAAAGAASLNAEGFLDVLSVDFARALKDLAAVMTDLQSLAGLGDLPVFLETSNVLRVRFPGMDAEAVERLCDDVGVKRGVVGQDPDFGANPAVDMALRFPFAPDAAGEDALTSPGGSLRSHWSESSSDIEEAFIVQELEENPWQLSFGSEPEGYESMSPPIPGSAGDYCSEDFEGLEGIYRFLEECDRARGRFR